MQDLLQEAAQAGIIAPDEFRKITPFSSKKVLMSAFQSLLDKHGTDTRSLLEEWFRSKDGCHSPSCGEEKGDLLRWKTVAGCRVPTIRQDLVGMALEGKIEVRDGQNLLDFIGLHLKGI